ncbi:MAG TPA: hypothetical protein VFD38_04790 [Myxococcaceae bacterium]|nr:hypothetical protein [Myxococcaceae bacterium]
MSAAVWRSSGLFSILIVLASCGSSEQQSAGDAIGRYLAAVKSGDGSVVGQLRSGNVPTGSGPSIQASTSGAVLPGGSNLIAISAGGPVSRVLVGVQGVDGYYELGGLAAGAAQSVLVTLAQSPPSSFSFLFAGGDGNGVGPSTAVPVTVTSVGTGDVQVTVSWDAESDVDLHVVDPAGEEIYYANRISASGGELDLDSNAACSLDHVKAENITWPTGKAPSGTYRVLVDYWNACGQAQTRYVVTVNVKGQQPKTFPATLAGPGDQGGECFSGSNVVCGVELPPFTFP